MPDPNCRARLPFLGTLAGSSAVLDRQYSFIDGSGTLRTRRVRDMLTTTALKYTYTAGAGCPAAAPAATPVAPVTVAQASQATPEARMAPTLPGGGFEIGKGTTEVPVELEGSAATLRPSAAQGPVASAVVTVEGLTAYAPPGVLFDVYLADANGRRAQIGVIDFFAFGQGGGGGRHAAHGAGGRTVEFDATDAVRALGLESNAKPRLLFEATTGLSDSTPALAAEAFATDAQVSFRRARLRVDR